MPTFIEPEVESVSASSNMNSRNGRAPSAKPFDTNAKAPSHLTLTKEQFQQPHVDVQHISDQFDPITLNELPWNAGISIGDSSGRMQVTHRSHHENCTRAERCISQARTIENDLLFCEFQNVNYGWSSNCELTALEANRVQMTVSPEAFTITQTHKQSLLDNSSHYWKGTAVCPRQLTPNLCWESWPGVAFHVSHLCSVTVGDVCSNAICIQRASVSATNPRRVAMYEIYIDIATGLRILQRRYSSDQFHCFERLDAKTGRMVEGVDVRLDQDSVYYGG